jgi:gluconolactonase
LEQNGLFKKIEFFPKALPVTCKYNKKRIFRLMMMTLVCLFLYNQCARRPIPRTKWIKIADHLNFPEGPAWDYHNSLYISSCYGGWIARIQSELVDTFLISQPDSGGIVNTNGLVANLDGSLYACDFGLRAILHISKNGNVDKIASDFEGMPFQRPNDLAVDSTGSIYFSDPGQYDCKNPDGCVYYVNPGTREVRLVANRIAYPNGVALSPDHKYLYVCESACSRILRYQPLANGRLSRREAFIEISGGDPDGIAFDRKGNLYVAYFGSGAIYVISPSREILQIVPTPGKKPSNLEFGSPDLRTLYLTEDETNSVYKIQVRIAGFPLFQSRISPN